MQRGLRPLTSLPEDEGRLRSALAPLLAADDQVPQPTLRRLSRDVSAALWDAFILQGKDSPRERHGMLLGPDAWPSVTKATPLTLPLPATFTSARQWLVFWMRERAALVLGSDLESSLDALLDEDDEALIAINTDTLDSVQSWGGHGRWVTMKRPR